jgi:uridylate kinase
MASMVVIPGRTRTRSAGRRSVLEQDLRVIDQSAIVLARDYRLPLHVFDFDEGDAIAEKVWIGKSPAQRPGVLRGATAAP